MAKPAGLPNLRLFAVICVLAVTAVGALLYPRLAASPDAAVEPMPALLATTPIRPGEPLLPLPDSLPVDPAKVALGRLLFNDPRLSRDDSLACAGCHDLQRGGADGLPVSRGVDGKKGGINAPTVLNAAFNFRQFWDGRAATLEEQVEGPVHNPLEMAADWDQVLAKLQADKELRSRFASAYPAGLTAATVRHAIAEYERSLLTPSRFDRWLRGDDTALSDEEKAGYRLFKRHGCSSCHQGVNVGGNLFQRFGVMDNYFANKKALTAADMGRFNVTGRDEDRHVFKVPTLRNVALTAPYFHDAATSSLDEAVALMGRYQLGVELPARDVTLIVTFLQSLNGDVRP
ncbi:cytochrome-c peroxidase [Azospira sp.]|uniref:cytochrome-c peroxidase n=1 Tax=Azospira sp. TaxID=1872671 RepID=UPI002561099A|nr:cytochrome-c peroxidase [Azospira sp.]MDK9691705.1 cytochrome-c peroxidase [Azospira sp.]